MTSDKLQEYRSKRDFQRTKEPAPEIKRQPTKEPIFVIQKHDASHLHYDFRLEVDGVLKSWAIPKGPSLDPQVKRLAVPTEDHPMAYGGFEGTIPQGEYGGGTVMVWDSGNYENIQAAKEKPLSMAEALAAGRIEVFLKGKKLRGLFALIRTTRGWLLFKMKDEYARTNDILAEEPNSAVTGRTLEEIAAAP
ncbi:ATP-dependent DNA ligase LigD [Dehalogenimonas sp. WBC-2]|nr:ATP-dependent DNA ligase LigD [Dehalogenimonas sp. WBC-2]